MKFDINNYSNMYVMHCKTEDEANMFLEFLDSIGMMWSDNGSYLSRNKYGCYFDKTCYNFWNGEFCYLDYYKSQGCTILEFSNFEWDDEPLEVSTDDSDTFFGFLSCFNIV